MESYSLNSRIIEDQKEFLVQTSNDTRQGVINSSVFVDGELLDTAVFPHADHVSEEQMLQLVKSTHGEKKAELEYLLKSFQEIMHQGQPKMMYHFGTALYYKRMYVEARRLFQTAVKLNNEYHEAWFYLSQTELALKNLDDATIAGNKAADMRPKFADYRNNLGEVYLAAGSCKRAAMEFKEAATLNVYYADAYFNLALAYILNGVNKEDFEMASELPDKCLDLINKSILIYPEFEGGRFEEAMALLKKGDYKNAYNLFSLVREAKTEKIRHQKAAHFNRFLIYTDWLSEKSISERIEFLEAEIDKNPNYVDLYYELGLCLLHQARFSWKKGSEYFRKALTINGNLRKAQRGLELAEEHFLKMADAVSDISDDQTHGR